MFLINATQTERNNWLLFDEDGEMMRLSRKILSVILCLSILAQMFCSTSKAGGLVVYNEGKIEEEKVEEVMIPEEVISQQYIRQHMIYEDELYEVQITESLIAQAYIIETTVDVDTQTSMAGLLPPQFGDYEINWPAVIAKFAIGTAIIIAVGVVQYLTKGTSTYFIMATPGKVLKDALIGGAIEATLQTMANEIGQGGISAKAATKYAIEGFADGFMWGSIASVMRVTAQDIKRLKNFKLATGGTLKIKLDGTVLDKAGNIIGQAVYDGQGQWYLLENANKFARSFDAQGKEIARISTPANSTLSIGAKDNLKVCYTDDHGNIFRIGDDLLPNNTYTIKNKVYRTDKRGRIINVSFDSLQRKNPKRGRLPIIDSKEAIGRGYAKTGDDKGHLIADVFDGDNTMANIVPMSSRVNKGPVKKVENSWVKALKKGSNVNGSISVTYKGDSFRPSEFTYSYEIDGIRYDIKIPNN